MYFIMGQGLKGLCYPNCLNISSFFASDMFSCDEMITAVKGEELSISTSLLALMNHFLLPKSAVTPGNSKQALRYSSPHNAWHCTRVRMHPYAYCSETTLVSVTP